MIDIPVWCPAPIADEIRKLEKAGQLPWKQEVLERLATDARMQQAYKELLRRDRTSKAYLHKARLSPKSKSSSAENDQITALTELFLFVFTAVGRQTRTSKPQEIEAQRRSQLGDAQRLRMIANDVELLADSQELGMADPVSKQIALADAAALRRVAKWLEHISGAMRRPDNPLMVAKHRGDPIVRGVQIAIGAKVQDLFGDRLDRITLLTRGFAVENATSSKSELRARWRPAIGITAYPAGGHKLCVPI